MRLLRDFFYLGAPPPNPRDLPLFFRQNGQFCFFQGDRLNLSPPFRPLNRSLGLLPSIALSRPVQVGSLSTVPFVGSMKKQRTASTPLTSCLTIGVHRSAARLLRLVLNQEEKEWKRHDTLE